MTPSLTKFITDITKTLIVKTINNSEIFACKTPNFRGIALLSSEYYVIEK